MGTDWLLYKSMIDGGYQNQDSSRDAAIQGAIDVFADGIINDPAYQSDATINGNKAPIVASRKSTIECQVKALPGTDLHIGDMVDCLGNKWIVVECYEDKIGVINAVMWLCNTSISFQNHTPSIYNKFCVVDDGTYSKKSSDPDAFVMANTYKLYVTLDEDTEKLFVDKRIGLGSVYSNSGDKILEVYKIIGTDLKSKNFGENSHLMLITMQRDVYNKDTDSIELNICDVIHDEPTEATYENQSEWRICGKDAIRIGTSGKYTAVGDQTTEQLSDVKWCVRAPDAVILNSDGRTCKIHIPLDAELVGSDIYLQLCSADGNMICEKKVGVITVG